MSPRGKETDWVGYVALPTAPEVTFRVSNRLTISMFNDIYMVRITTVLYSNFEFGSVLGSAKQETFGSIFGIFPGGRVGV